MVVRRALTVRGRRILPLGRVGEYIECDVCRATYRPEVLAYDAGPDTPRVMAEYQRVMKRLLALMVVSDGVIAEPEIETVRKIFEAISGQSLARSDVLDEAEAVTRTPATVARYLASVAAYLNEYGKEQVLRAAAEVSRADGAVHLRERELVLRLAALLRADPASVSRVLRQLG